jgi:AraC-like DNA-binding protein
MSLILSEKALPTLSQEEGSSLPLKQLSTYELTLPRSEAAPQSSSRGYKRSINLRYGLNLLIRDYWLQDVLIEENLVQPLGQTLEFGFELLGTHSGNRGSRRCSNGFLELSQNNSDSGMQTWYREWADKGRVLKIDLHLRIPSDSSSFTSEQLMLIPQELQAMIDTYSEDWFIDFETLSPNIHLVLQQILNCPYTGSIQQVYLEGKALELIALQSVHFLQFDRSNPHQSLKRSDVERIHQARAIVTQRLENPPSLLGLARAVGLNDCTLKRGFRQVFGTTVFSYIRQQRLMKARQLLQDTEMSVAEVTCLVGYTHPGHFAAAFKREFGVSPKVFQNSVR